MLVFECIVSHQVTFDIDSNRALRTSIEAATYLSTGIWIVDCLREKQTNKPNLCRKNKQTEFMFESFVVTITYLLWKNNILSISGRVDRASTTERVDLVLIPGRVKPKSNQIGSHSFPA